MFDSVLARGTFPVSVAVASSDVECRLRL